MSAKNRTEELIRKRIDDISQLINEVASGNFDYKMELSEYDDELEGLIEGINMLGEELKASTVSRDFMESIYRGVVDILMILKPDLTIERVNNAVLEHLGYAVADLENQPFSILLKPADLAFIQEITERLETQKACYNIELNLLRKDGSMLPSSASFSILYDNHKTQLGILIIAKDITFLKESEKQMRAAKEKAEAANEAKSSFLANMSHEIRTPLNGIMGFIELLMETKTDEKQTQYLKMIQASGASLTKLLNDILDLNRVEQGKLTLENIAFAPEETLNSDLKPYHHLAREKGIQFDCQFDPSLPNYLIGDPSRVKQIIRNLVGNALKFTESGFVKVQFSGEFQTDDWILFTGKVIDTGTGVPKDKQHKIFESFTQADNSTTRKYGGSGLGLTITTHLIKLMGGRVKMESPPATYGMDQGSIFTFTIPLKVGVTPKKHELFQKYHQVSFLHPYEILVVDDNEINLILARKMLETMGALVTDASNGEEAIQLSSARKFDVILMDIQMPVMDGYLASAQIRSQQFKGPIIALSANVYLDDIERCYQSGMNRHVRKPYTKEEIYVAIEGSLEAL